jgi:hypothetical protein
MARDISPTQVTDPRNIERFPDGEQLTSLHRAPTLRSIRGEVQVTVGNGVGRQQRGSAIELVMENDVLERLVEHMRDEKFSNNSPACVRNIPRPRPDQLDANGWNFVVCKSRPWQTGRIEAEKQYGSREWMIFPGTGQEFPAQVTEIFTQQLTRASRNEVLSRDFVFSELELDPARHKTTVARFALSRRINDTCDLRDDTRIGEGEAIYFGHGWNHAGNGRDNHIRLAEGSPMRFTTPHGYGRQTYISAAANHLEVIPRNIYVEITSRRHRSSAEFMQRRIASEGRMGDPMSVYLTATGTGRPGYVRNMHFMNTSLRRFELENDTAWPVVNELRHENVELAASKLEDRHFITPSLESERLATQGRYITSLKDAIEVVEDKLPAGYYAGTTAALCRKSQGNDPLWLDHAPFASRLTTSIRTSTALPLAGSLLGDSQPTVAIWDDDRPSPRLQHTNPRQFGQGGVVNNVANSISDIVYRFL